MRARILCAIDGGVTRHVLGLLVVVMVVLLAAATKHLVEEAKLRRDGARQGEKQQGKEAHPVFGVRRGNNKRNSALLPVIQAECGKSP